MKIAVGLPNAARGIEGPELLAWATAAERLGFSSLGALSRIPYDSHEELVALAAAAGATSRIRLATTVTVAPVREPVLLAKQAATLDAVSGGRFTLGLGVGWRTDDFEAAGGAYRRRGRALEQLIPQLRRIWAGEAPAAGVSPVGPQPAAGRPEIIVGGQTPAALERAGRLADGYIALGMFPARVPPNFEAVTQAWRAAGRPGEPRLLAGVYFALGEGAQQAAHESLLSFYAPGGERLAEAMATTVCTTPEAIDEAKATFESMGTDELFFWPAIGGRGQLDRLAEAAL